jgi:cation diffusion facilitator family transporter
MMIIEIAAGYVFGSMALLADGWHMGTHAVALSITAFAYYYARKHSDNPNYSFGTGKVGVLGGFGSAVVLAVIALLMGVESIKRLVSPTAIQFNEAIAVAVVGLIVNLVSAFLLQDKHQHAHANGSNKHHHHDHNLRAAYLHVLADALTSLLAIIALLTGKAFGWIWMDPIMGAKYCWTGMSTRKLFQKFNQKLKPIPITGYRISISGGSVPIISQPSYPW